MHRHLLLSLPFWLPVLGAVDAVFKPVNPANYGLFRIAPCGVHRSGFMPRGCIHGSVRPVGLGARCRLIAPSWRVVALGETRMNQPAQELHLVHPAGSSAASRRRLAARGRVLGRPDSWTIGAPCVLATNAEPLAG